MSDAAAFRAEEPTIPEGDAPAPDPGHLAQEMARLRRDLDHERARVAAYRQALLESIRDAQRMHDTLTSAQEASTRDITDARAMRKIVSASPGLARALADVVHERKRQDDKFGGWTPARLAVRLGTGSDVATELREAIRRACDDAMSNGQETWALILAEEVIEAIAESDTKRLRDELVQVAAVAALIIERIDRGDAPPARSEGE